MSNPIQNFYKSTITQDWSIGTGNFYVSVKPTTSVGRLVVSPSSDTLREIVEYTSTGTDGNGDYIVVSVRGVGGTTEQTHTVGEKVRMNITAEDWEDMRDDIDSIVAAGAPNASTVQKGIGELATPAQIDALIEDGETGGPLLINPKQLGDAHNIPHVAPGTSGNILVSNGTDWVSQTQLSNLPVGTTYDFSAKLATDFTVTNNATLTEVTGFSFSVGADEIWQVEIYGGVTASDSTGDIKYGLVASANCWNTSVPSAWYEATYFAATGTLTNVTPTAPSSNTEFASLITNGNNYIYPIRLRYFFSSLSGAATISFRIANQAASEGRTSTLKAGAYMLARKLK